MHSQSKIKEASWAFSTLSTNLSHHGKIHSHSMRSLSTKKNTQQEAQLLLW